MLWLCKNKTASVIAVIKVLCFQVGCGGTCGVSWSWVEPAEGMKALVCVPHNIWRATKSSLRVLVWRPSSGVQVAAGPGRSKLYSGRTASFWPKAWVPSVPLDWETDIERKSMAAQCGTSAVCVCVCVVSHRSVWCPRPRSPELPSPDAAACHVWWDSRGQHSACGGRDEGQGLIFSTDDGN